MKNLLNNMRNGKCESSSRFYDLFLLIKGILPTVYKTNANSCQLFQNEKGIGGRNCDAKVKIHEKIIVIEIKDDGKDNEGDKGKCRKYVDDNPDHEAIAVKFRADKLSAELYIIRNPASICEFRYDLEGFVSAPSFEMKLIDFLRECYNNDIIKTNSFHEETVSVLLKQSLENKKGVKYVTREQNLPGVYSIVDLWILTQESREILIEIKKGYWSCTNNCSNLSYAQTSEKLKMLNLDTQEKLRIRTELNCKSDIIYTAIRNGAISRQLAWAVCQMRGLNFEDITGWTKADWLISRLTNDDEVQYLSYCKYANGKPCTIKYLIGSNYALQEALNLVCEMPHEEKTIKTLSEKLLAIVEKKYIIEMPIKATSLK